MDEFLTGFTIALVAFTIVLGVGLCVVIVIDNITYEAPE